MNPFEAYVTYCALKAHFSAGKYDYFKYKGKMNVSADTFEKRNDKYFFHRLSKQFKNKEIESFLLANMVSSNGTGWIGNMDMSTESQSVYIQWKKKMEALSNVFRGEFEEVCNWLDIRNIHFNQLFMVCEIDHPIILKMVLSDMISLETFIIMNEVLNFFPHFDEKLSDDIVWDEYRIKAIKYKRFLKINKEKYKKIMINCINILA